MILIYLFIGLLVFVTLVCAVIGGGDEGVIIGNVYEGDR
jgi:hypothetical protein